MKTKKVTLEKTVGAREARENFSTILDTARYQRQRYIVSKNGQQSAVILPLADYQKFKTEEDNARKELSEMVRTIQKRANLSEEEANKLADEAVAWARSNRKS